MAQGPGVDLQGADLTDANCWMADFSSGDLSGANLTRTNFKAANLSLCAP